MKIETLNEKQRKEIVDYLEEQGMKEAQATVTTYEQMGVDAETTIEIIKEDYPEVK